VAVPYTLAKFGFWLIAAGIVGVVVGWLLRGPRSPAAVADPIVEEPQATVALTADDATELARLRVRVNYLEPIAAEVAELRREREQRADSGRNPDDTWPADLPLQEDVLLAEHERLSALVTSYQAENGELRARLWNSDSQIRDLQAVLTEYRTAMVPTDPDVEAGAEVLGVPVLLNDLTLVQGIGPKIATLLREHGITTWWQLHLAGIDALRSLLQEAGPRFEVHDPTTWPAQAGLLAHGNWHEFAVLIDAVKGGKLAG
jgi:predicted flap endonuclease-1-like 5' DNA nuclease